MLHALKHASKQNDIVNLKPRCQQLNLCLVTLPSDYIYTSIMQSHLHKIMMTNNLLLLLKTTFPSIYLS